MNTWDKRYTDRVQKKREADSKSLDEVLVRLAL